MNQPLTIAASTLQQIRQHARSAFPHECCGILLGRDQLDRRLALIAQPTENAAPIPDRRHRFVIPPKSLLSAERQAAHLGMTVLGFYHSHPNSQPIPSPTDAEHAWEFYSYLIVSVLSDSTQPRSWRWTRAAGDFTEELLHIAPDQ